MGVYTTIYFTCPRCDNSLEVQGSRGEVHSYSANAVPPEEAEAIIGDEILCTKCNRSWEIIEKPQRSVVRLGLAATDDLY